MQVWESSHSFTDFCCVRRYLFTDYLALADDCHMEVPVSMCLPAVWALLLLLVFSSKQWNHAVFKKKNQLLGSSEKTSQIQRYINYSLVNKASFEMLNPCAEEHLACTEGHLARAGDATLGGIWWCGSERFLLLKMRSTRGKNDTAWILNVSRNTCHLCAITPGVLIIFIHLPHFLSLYWFFNDNSDKVFICSFLPPHHLLSHISSRQRSASHHFGGKVIYLIVVVMTKPILREFKVWYQSTVWLKPLNSAAQRCLCFLLRHAACGCRWSFGWCDALHLLPLGWCSQWEVNLMIKTMTESAVSMNCVSALPNRRFFCVSVKGVNVLLIIYLGSGRYWSCSLGTLSGAEFAHSAGREGKRVLCPTALGRLVTAFGLEDVCSHTEHPAFISVLWITSIM